MVLVQHRYGSRNGYIRLHLGDSTNGNGFFLICSSSVFVWYNCDRTFPYTMYTSALWSLYGTSSIPSSPTRNNLVDAVAFGSVSSSSLSGYKLVIDAGQTIPSTQGVIRCNCALLEKGCFNRSEMPPTVGSLNRCQAPPTPIQAQCTAPTAISTHFNQPTSTSSTSPSTHAPGILSFTTVPIVTPSTSPSTQAPGVSSFPTVPIATSSTPLTTRLQKPVPSTISKPASNPSSVRLPSISAPHQAQMSTKASVTLGNCGELPPCENGGTCTRKNGNYECLCSWPSFGPVCQHGKYTNS